MLASVLASTKRARPPPPPPPPPPAAAGSQVCLMNATLLKAGHECSSADSSLGGKQPSLSACAMLCARRPGCVYFIYGTGGKKRGDCYVEHTATAACTEGWEADDFDTYELGSPLPADADELKSDDDETDWTPDDEDGVDEDDWSDPKPANTTAPVGRPMPPTVEKDREITEARALLGLRPGMTYCELGAASHHMTALGKAVMPGGHVVVTAPNQYQLDDLTRAAKDAGLPITALLASDVKMGIGVDSCDAILARMVYHMISEAVARDVYLPQLARALRRGGRVLILDHDDPNHSTRVNASLGGMAVVPKLQEIREFTDAGFALLRLLEWPHFGDGEYGYGLLLVDAPRLAPGGGDGAGHSRPHAPPADADDHHRLVVAGVGCAALSALLSGAVLVLVLRPHHARRLWYAGV